MKTDKTDEQIIKEFAALRQKMNWSQEMVARELKMHRQHISDMEKYKRIPSRQHIYKLAYFIQKYNAANVTWCPL